MKKLAVLLQIIGVLAVCPIYILLEITHSTNQNSVQNQESSIKQSVDVIKRRITTDPANDTQSATYFSNTK